MPLGMEVGLGPGHIVLVGDHAPPKRGAQPQFSAHLYCGQTAGWIKVILGRDVGLGPCDIVLGGDPVRSRRVFNQHCTNLSWAYYEELGYVLS